MATVFDPEVDVHVSSYPWASKLWQKSRVQKRALIRRKDVYPVCAYLVCIVELQRIWRGVLLRRRVLRKFLHMDFRRLWKVDEDQFEQVYRRVPRAPESKFVQLAQRVQARWRTVLLRQEYNRWAAQEVWPVYYAAAATIQRAWVDYQYVKRRKAHRNRSKRFYLTKNDAHAGKIQNAWRCFVYRQVFQFHLQLIKFREGGDPALMLKCINPQEAMMMDPAAGLHVRFRLAGSAFPPQVVYKVFTHNNVADICSFAPKDYTKTRKKQAPKVLHNNTHTQPKKDRTGWYQRYDNNPWRPVATDILENAEEIAEKYVLAEKTKQPDIIPEDATYHHSRLKRRGERELKEKKIRRKWLAELYAGEQQQHQTQKGPDRLRAEANRIFEGMTDKEVEDETGKLREWTDHLDYAAYRKDWLALASTAPTDLVVNPASKTTKL